MLEFIKKYHIIEWTLALSVIPLVFSILATLANQSMIIGIRVFFYTYGAMLLVPIGLSINKEKHKRNRPDLFGD